MLITWYNAWGTGLELRVEKSFAPLGIQILGKTINYALNAQRIL